MGKKIGIAALVVAAVFLAGFLPQYVQRTSVEKRLAEAEQHNREAHLRDLAALAYVQAGQKNYGLAAQTCTDFFSRTQQHAAGNATPAFSEILSMRDRVTAELAKGDPAALNDLQTLYLKTRSATAAQ